MVVTIVEEQWPGNHCCRLVEGMALVAGGAALQRVQKKREPEKGSLT